MTVSPFLRPLGITAAILGTLQGLLWTVLSLLVILLSTGTWEPENEGIKLFETAAEVLFFNDTVGSDLEIIFTGDAVLGIGCFYLVISFIWTVTSLTLMWVFFREKYDQARTPSITWCWITCILTVVDVVVMIILAVDLGYIETREVPEGFEDLVKISVFIYSTVIGTAMTIVARGYILLIVHPIIAYFLYKYANKIQSSQKPPTENRPYINAYQEPWFSNEDPRGISGNRGENNGGFIPDDDIYHRSVSQEQQPPIRRFVPSPSQDSYIPGRPQKTKAPVPPREHGPYIPEPDYDNPRRELERMPKSALRTKSYY